MQSLGTVASQALSQDSKNTLSELEKNQRLEAARLLLGCYRTGEANDPEVYVSSVIRILCDYPIEIVWMAIDPVHGIPSRRKWLPTAYELKSELEELYGPRRRMIEREASIRKQLEERKEWESRKPDPEVVERVRNEMAAAGMPIMGDRIATKPKGLPFARYTDEQLRDIYR